MIARLMLAAAATSFATGFAAANDPLNANLSTPLPFGPGTYVPPGSTLNAPVMTPAGTCCGKNLFDITPATTDCCAILKGDPSRYCAGQDVTNAFNPCAERVGWLSVEFLYWATQGTTIPPLVTTGPASLGAAAGSIGQPSTQDVFGGNRALNGLRPGFRITGGLFLDDSHDWALSHQIISLGSRSERLTGGSDGTNLVDLPQFGTVAGVPVQTPLFVGFPGVSKGTVTASDQTSFFSGDTHLRRVYQDPRGVRLDMLAGYRFLQLGDSISDSFDIVSATAPAATTPRLMGEDSVRTRNFFHGGEVGFNLSGVYHQVTFEMQTTLAMGVTVSDLDQSRTRSAFIGSVGVPVVQTAYHNSTDYFSVVPQTGFKLGWQPMDHVRFTAGYDIL
ncbi:MAG TPA: BBP7 family outer membrane beta-barrel protein, partial [Urbifossiella sp.]